MQDHFGKRGRRRRDASLDPWETGRSRKRNEWTGADLGFERSHRAPGAHTGFRLGLVGGVVMVAVHIFMLLIFQATNQGDVLAWMIGWFVYYFIGRAAGNAQFRQASNQDFGDPTREVKAAGKGAGLVTSVIVWIFILLRGVFRDAVGITVLVDPLGLCITMFIDVLLAMGLGTIGARHVENKYRIRTNF